MLESDLPPRYYFSWNSWRSVLDFGSQEGWHRPWGRFSSSSPLLWQHSGDISAQTGSGHHYMAQYPGLLWGSRNVFFRLISWREMVHWNFLYWYVLCSWRFCIYRVASAVSGGLLVLAIFGIFLCSWCLCDRFRALFIRLIILALILILHIFLGVFFGQGSRPRMWASTPWAICRFGTGRLSTIDYF